MERYIKKQVLSKSGMPNVRFYMPTEEDLEKVKQMRIREALLADPTLGGKITEAVWTGNIDNGSDKGNILEK